MISFQLTEEQEVVREAMHDFAEQAIRPAARDADEESKLPEALLAQIHELGLIATQLPAEHGGGGEERSPVTMAILLEELAWGDAALAAAALAPAAFAFAIADAGTEDQRRELLPLFCGESFHAAALALVEPGALFDPAKLATRAEARDDGFVLSGAKSLVPLGDRASHFLVVAASGDGRDAFVVPRDAAGLTISEPEKNLGLKALPTTTLRFQALELPAAARLGGSTGCDVQRLVDGARVALATTMTGVSRAALEFCVPYAKDRRAFDQAIAQKQGIAFPMAEMHIETDCQRWLAWQAASQLERGLDSTRAAHLARAYSAEKSMWIADQGVQTLGGHGFIREHPVEMWYRNARTLSVLEGMLAL
ncbi:MAG: acyl-CoA dehydrogenase family protein [Myxococcota bacterium]|nr:acyl-CoA dehydrogenase [Deltaproteobacteria bacterium]MCP4242527.1 acyl-CoA dehydrogenase [bacterium]MDP6074795.1 acyl-CoA dehydrogenase family protein [Myxococcota bacterium]MDP6244254.1 acyl-CoA dehydrogenase family protein [Myxococcota bacterium]MDP7075761.1 acyl-CoA dehydrogenase family protein [Myxococcota bacterium]